MHRSDKIGDCFGGAFRQKRVLITGHTGFKGSWLCEWLLQLDAKVTGFALPPPTNPALFDQLSLGRRLSHRTGDIRDLASVRAAVGDAKPDYIFHLAAQPLVRRAYAEPVETYSTNIMGTVHLLEAVRLSGLPCVVVAVTTDKCYENKERIYSYHEEDPMGGYDPYSSSKGAAELVIAAYRRSFFSSLNATVRLASARAGNVIGGGDWALDRIMPDCIRALQLGEPVPVRNKVATRPWQHVLEPLSGYLWLGARLAGATGNSTPDIGLREGKTSDQNKADRNTQLEAAFNFGPALSSNRTVADLVQETLKHWPGRWVDRSDPKGPHEAGKLNLATDKAFHLLGWQPAWEFTQAVEKTVSWYRRVAESPGLAPELTSAQIADYVSDARTLGLDWSQ